MAATDLERLIVQLEAQSTKLDKALSGIVGNVDRQLNRVEKRTDLMNQRVTAGFGKAGAAIAAFFSVRAVVGFIDRVTEAADKLQALSDRTGVGTDQLQKLAAAARAANVDTEQLNDALEVFARNVGRATQGQGDLAKIFKELGIVAGDDLIATLLDVADAVQNAKTRTEEYRIVTAALGRSSVELVGLLRQGRGAIQEQMDAFRSGISPEAVRSLAEFNQHWKEISVSFTNMAAGPAAFVLEGLSNFLRTLEQGTWVERLQALASFFSGGLIAQPQVLLEDRITATANALDNATNQVIKLNAELERARSPFDAARIKKELGEAADEMVRLQTELAALTKQRPPPAPKAKDKPFGDEFQGDIESARNAIARALAEQKQAEAQLASQIAQANAEALRGTNAYYDAVREQIRVTTESAIEAAEEKKNADIAALDETKLGLAQYAQIVLSVEARTEAEKQSIREKGREDLNRINNEEIEDARQKAERLETLAETQADALERVARDSAEAQRDLQRAQTETRVIEAEGTPDQFQAIRDQIEENLLFQKQAIDEAEAAEIESLRRIFDERVEAGENELTAFIELQDAITKAQEEGVARRQEVEEIARQERIQRAKEEQELRLSLASDFFGNLATLTQSGNETLKAIGKAAAIAQATIDGILAVQKALASAPPPLNFALAASVGVATAANIARIAAMEKGGIVGPDGPVPLRRYAGGGIASSPQLALFGEGSQNEAFVPLPDGRRIPVTLKMPDLPPARQLPTQFVIRTELSLDGANGDDTIRRFAEQGARAGAALAIRDIRRQFPDMMASAQRRKL